MGNSTERTEIRRNKFFATALELARQFYKFNSFDKANYEENFSFSANFQDEEARFATETGLIGSNENSSLGLLGSFFWNKRLAGNKTYLITGPVRGHVLAIVNARIIPEKNVKLAELNKLISTKPYRNNQNTQLGLAPWVAEELRIAEEKLIRRNFLRLIDLL